MIESPAQLPRERRYAFSERYRGPITSTVIQQVLFAVICLLMLDGGLSARVCATAMIGFWAAALLILFRRPSEPGTLDLALIRWGFLPVLAVTVLWMRILF